MPAPIENHEELYRFLMKLNHRLVGVEFSLDADGMLAIPDRRSNFEKP